MYLIHFFKWFVFSWFNFGSSYASRNSFISSKFSIYLYISFQNIPSWSFRFHWYWFWYSFSSLILNLTFLPLPSILIYWGFINLIYLFEDPHFCFTACLYKFGLISWISSLHFIIYFYLPVWGFLVLVFIRAWDASLCYLWVLWFLIAVLSSAFSIPHRFW
jgi:hypothetical protein